MIGRPAIRAVTLVLIVALDLVLAQPTASLAQADSSSPPHALLAYYYAWYDPGSLTRARFQPTVTYQSDDPSLMQRHVSEAQQAGIDGFVMSWLGNGDRTDSNLAKLLDIGQKSGFKATIDFETPQFWGMDDVIAQLQAFYQNRIGHPAILTYQGRPVIFFWRASTYDNATWSSIRQQVDPDHRAVWIADGDNFGFLAGDAWDGISPYAIAWSANPASQLPSWAAKARAVAPDKLWIPPISPGCDDSAARSPATCVQDRGGGAYYSSTMQGALSSQPSWAVIVNTFNEWLEATEIEPSAEYGDQYLLMTRDFANTWKNSSSLTEQAPFALASAH